jgi:streptogramin lyase
MLLTHQSSSNLRLFALVFALVAGLAIALGAMLSAAHAADLFRFTQYRVPTDNSEPRYITVGSDGNLWFTEGNEFFTPNPDPNTGGTFHTQIGRITPAGNKITEFRVDGCQCFLNDIVQGPNNILYITTNSNLLVSITTAGTVQPFIETPFSVGDSLARSGDDLWINDFNTGSIWRYNITNDAFTEFPTGSTPLDVAVDDQGIVWFAGTDANGDGQIGRLDPDPLPGAITTTPVTGSTPGHIAIASDGKVWFTDRFNHRVGYLDPSNNNQVTQFGTLTPNAGPQDIAAANDGSMWFAQARVGNVARITPDGTITEAGRIVKDDPNSGLESAFGITFLPEDQSVWYTKPADNMVAHLTPR